MLKPQVCFLFSTQRCIYCVWKNFQNLQLQILEIFTETYCLHSDSRQSCHLDIRWALSNLFLLRVDIYNLHIFWIILKYGWIIIISRNLTKWIPEAHHLHQKVILNCLDCIFQKSVIESLMQSHLLCLYVLHDAI